MSMPGNINKGKTGGSGVHPGAGVCGNTPKQPTQPSIPQHQKIDVTRSHNSGKSR